MRSEINQIVRCILVGESQSFGPKGQLSAYVKTPIDRSVVLTKLGIIGDHQADKKHHGGVDKALFHYPSDHYRVWESERPELTSYLRNVGAFGENVSSSGADETNVFIGDQYKLGSAIIEISQGRQPCWKLGHFFNDLSMVKAVVDTGRGGWYYRVLTQGEFNIGDKFELIERPNPMLSVKKVFDVLIAKNKDIDTLSRLVELDTLSPSWQLRAEKMFAKYKRQQEIE